MGGRQWTRRCLRCLVEVGQGEDEDGGGDVLEPKDGDGVVTEDQGGEEVREGLIIDDVSEWVVDVPQDLGNPSLEVIEAPPSQ